MHFAKPAQYSTQSGSDGIEGSISLKTCVLTALSKLIPSLPLRVLYCIDLLVGCFDSFLLEIIYVRKTSKELRTKNQELRAYGVGAFKSCCISGVSRFSFVNSFTPVSTLRGGV